MKRGEGASGVPRETRVDARLAALAQAHTLEGGQVARLAALLEALAGSPTAPSTVTDPGQAVDVHIADSLSALALPELASPAVIADLGSGAGFPALALAVARPAARVYAVESVGRKCRFIESAASHAGIANVEVVCGRAETWTEGRELCDVVCARALARLAVLCEYAAPLLKPGGALVAWKAEVDRDEARGGERAAAQLGLSRPVPVDVDPYPGSHSRRLYVTHKIAETPAGFPRRPGMAAKRPLA